MIRKLFALAVAAALAGTAVAADLKSGNQPGDKVSGAFHPYHVNGEEAGKCGCLYCKAGDDPVIAVFARTPNDPAVNKLLKALDAENVKHAKADMLTYAVFSGDKAALEPVLKDAAKKAELKKLIIAIEEKDEPIPEKYKLNKDADVTVVLYVNRIVQANHAFAKGKLTDKDIEAVVRDVSKIVK
jgi:hypothetical protein